MGISILKWLKVASTQSKIGFQQTNKNKNFIPDWYEFIAEKCDSLLYTFFDYKDYNEAAAMPPENRVLWLWKWLFYIGISNVVHAKTLRPLHHFRVSDHQSVDEKFKAHQEKNFVLIRKKFPHVECFETIAVKTMENMPFVFEKFVNGPPSSCLSSFITRETIDSANFTAVMLALLEEIFNNEKVSYGTTMAHRGLKQKNHRQNKMQLFI